MAHEDKDAKTRTTNDSAAGSFRRQTVGQEQKAHGNKEEGEWADLPLTGPDVEVFICKDETV